YLKKHIKAMNEDQRILYKKEQRQGYANMQAHMNATTTQGIKMLPVKDIPLISVIIPVYNDAQNICRSVDSILAQKLKNIEIFIIDDNSLDNTLEIIKKKY